VSVSKYLSFAIVSIEEFMSNQIRKLPTKISVMANATMCAIVKGKC